MIDMTPDKLFEMYGQLLNHSTKMLTWARENRWVALISEEAEYVSTLDRISHAESALSLSSDHHVSKSLVMEEILSKNEETYRRLLTRRLELSMMLEEAELKTETFVVEQFADSSSGHPQMQ